MTNDPEFRAALQLVNECLTYDVSSVSAVRALHAAAVELLDEDAADTARIAQEWTAVFSPPRPRRGNPRCIMNYARAPRMLARSLAVRRPRSGNISFRLTRPTGTARRSYGCHRRRDEEDLDRFAADVRDAGRDLRISHELGMKTHGIDPRWAKTSIERATRAVRDIVRALDQDGAATLPPIVDRAVLAAVERHLCARAAAAEEADKHRPN